MPADWSLEQDAARRGVVRCGTMPCPVLPPYGQATRQKEPRRLNPVGADAGSGDDDRLHLFGFQWRDPLPDAESFERLMQEAAKFIDAWIESRL